VILLAAVTSLALTVLCLLLPAVAPAQAADDLFDPNTLQAVRL
jgi:hypothetical protein